MVALLAGWVGQNDILGTAVTVVLLPGMEITWEGMGLLIRFRW